jgi:hypothetical protein
MNGVARARAGLCLLVCLAAAAVFTSACAPPLMKLPAGLGSTAANAEAALAEATSACRTISTFTAEIHVSGSIGASRVRGRLLAGFAAPASARLEALAPFGAPLFIFVAHQGDASLLLPRDERVLEHGRPEEVLDAVAGLPLSPAVLRVALTGCGVQPDASAARDMSGGWLRVPDGDGALFLRRASAGAPWRVAVALHRLTGGGDWRAEYAEASSGLPRLVRLASEDRRKFDVRLELLQPAVNETLGPDVFRLDPSRAVHAMSLDELRAIAPFAPSSPAK